MTSTAGNLVLDRRANWRSRIAQIGKGRSQKISACLLLLLAILAGASLLDAAGLHTNLGARNLPPSWSKLLGTDWLGRDMFTRVLLGLRLSLWVGFVAASVSAVLGVVLGLAAALGGTVLDELVGRLIDLVMSLPHLVFQILIAFASGGGIRGVIIAIALTHWASIARVIRTEAKRLGNCEYVLLSSRLGRSRWWIARHHLCPQILPQFLVGLILMFPHAISHEAALSFIGLGLVPHMPSMGIVLAESLRHLSTGHWWLAVFSGVALIVTVKSFDILAEEIRTAMSPRLREAT